MIVTRNNSQNYEKTIGAIKEITLYLNRRVGGLHGIKKARLNTWLPQLRACE